MSSQDPPASAVPSAEVTGIYHVRFFVQVMGTLNSGLYPYPTSTLPTNHVPRFPGIFLPCTSLTWLLTWESHCHRLHPSSFMLPLRALCEPSQTLPQRLTAGSGSYIEQPDFMLFMVPISCKQGKEMPHPHLREQFERQEPRTSWSRLVLRFTAMVQEAYSQPARSKPDLDCEVKGCTGDSA